MALGSEVYSQMKQQKNRQKPVVKMAYAKWPHRRETHLFAQDPADFALDLAASGLSGWLVNRSMP